MENYTFTAVVAVTAPMYMPTANKVPLKITFKNPLQRLNGFI